MVRSSSLPKFPEDEALAAEYALGVLSLEERQAFEARLRDDGALRSLVDAWDQKFLPLAEAIEPVAPPFSSFDAIERRLQLPAPTPNKSFFSQLWVWRSLSAAGFAAALVMAVIVYQPSGNQTSTQTAFVAQLQNEERSLNVAAYFDEAAETLILTRQSGRAEAGRDLELWLIPADSAPISLGTLPIRDRIEVAVTDDLRESISEGTAFAISDEPEGGSPTGQPTGDILAVGPVSSLNI